MATAALLACCLAMIGVASALSDGYYREGSDFPAGRDAAFRRRQAMAREAAAFRDASYAQLPFRRQSVNQVRRRQYNRNNNNNADISSVVSW